MDIRLVTVREDFEKAYNILNQKDYPLSFYEFVLKHDRFSDKNSLKLVGIFLNDECVGHLSYEVTACPYLERVLTVKEINQTNIKSYKMLMDFIDVLAKDENCRAIKISKKKIDRLNFSVFDKFENILKRFLH
jgi:hypothetical protein